MLSVDQLITRQVGRKKKVNFNLILLNKKENYYAIGVHRSSATGNQPGRHLAPMTQGSTGERGSSKLNHDTLTLSFLDKLSASYTTILYIFFKIMMAVYLFIYKLMWEELNFNAHYDGLESDQPARDLVPMTQKKTLTTAVLGDLLQPHREHSLLLRDYSMDRNENCSFKLALGGRPLDPSILPSS